MRAALDPTTDLIELLQLPSLGSPRASEQLRCALPLFPVVPWSWVDIEDPIPWRVLATALEIALALIVALLGLGWLLSDLVAIG